MNGIVGFRVSRNDSDKAGIVRGAYYCDREYTPCCILLVELLDKDLAVSSGKMEVWIHYNCTIIRPE